LSHTGTAGSIDAGIPPYVLRIYSFCKQIIIKLPSSRNCSVVEPVTAFRFGMAGLE
jgi:hypothetical protein